MAKQKLAGRGSVLTHLVRALRQAGYPTGILARAVPAWWNKETESKPGAVAHLKLLLARRLGLDVQSILESGEIKPVAPTGMKFKRSADREHESPPDPTLAFCGTLARSVAATIPPSDRLPGSGDEIRGAILADPSRRWVGLEDLLKYCWDRSIAVVHVSELPGKRKGMDALVYRFAGRDVIVLTRDVKTSPAWMSYLIAHELGHIALEHVRENEAYADHESDDANVLSAKAGTDEEAANAFARSVLAGSTVEDFWTDHGSTPLDLAKTAQREGVTRRIDPDHIILRYARESDCWPYAMSALTYTKQASVIPSKVINSLALDRMDLAELGDETSTMLSDTLRLAIA